MEARTESEAEATPAANASVVPRHAWWTLGVLTLVATLDHADRALIGAITEPLRQEFQFSDTEIGFLMGFAFVLFRAVIDIPVGRAADTWNRRNVLAIALSVWSLCTLLMGQARSFAQLAISRLVIGGATAGSWPPALSMVSDLFPLRLRGLAMGIWNVGTAAGFAIRRSGVRGAFAT